MCKMNYISSRFFCTECGNEGIPVFRNKGYKREDGHLKKMYCINCKCEHNFAEIKGSYTEESFRQEFVLGRFIEGKRLPIRDLPKCNKNCACNVQGRCWNTNGKNVCEVK